MKQMLHSSIRLQPRGGWVNMFLCVVSHYKFEHHFIAFFVPVSILYGCDVHSCTHTPIKKLKPLNK